jgi:type I restriction enzyme S subunit
LRPYIRGTTLKNLALSTAAEHVSVPLPDKAAQRRIAGILDRADALRAKRRAALAQLDSLTQSVFSTMFGDPVANPKEWPNPKLGGLLTFQQYGPRFYNEPYSQSGVRIVRITDLSETGDLDFGAMPRMDVSDDDKAKFMLKAGDLIFARTGATVGKVALIREEHPPCIAGAYFIRMRFRHELNPTYAQAVLRSPSIRAIVAKQSRQAAQQNFSGPSLRRLPMPLPPAELQRDFERYSDECRRQADLYSTASAELDALAHSLVQRAFRGEL